MQRGDKRSAKLLTALLICLWLAALYGFVSTPVWIVLSIVGPLMLRGGYMLVRDALPHIGEGVAYLGVTLFGALLVFGAAATLSAALPGSWLAESSPGRGLLGYRQSRLERAIKSENAGLAGWLAARGLGTTAPIDSFARPLLHDAGDARMVTALLGAGLSPDARDGEGRTLLMLTYDEGTGRALLEGGADTEVADLEGRTALAYARHKDIGHLEMLLAAGADVHATDHAGIHVSHEFPAAGPERALLEQFAGERPLPAPRSLIAADRGRTDWLLAARTSAESLVTMRPENPAPGERATLDIRIVNDTTQDRLIKVRAVLNNAAFLVGASHGGTAATPRIAGISRDVRWPLLTLPAKTEGGLTLDIVAGADPGSGDLSVDLRYREVGDPEDEVFGVYVSRSGEFSDDADTLTLILVPVAIGLALLIAGRVIGGWLRRKTSFAAGAAALLGALVCGGMTLVLAAGMLEPWFGLDETRCEIHDRRVRLETLRTTSGTGTMARSSYSTHLEPVVATSYDADNETITTTGFAIGAATRSVQVLDGLAIGESVPCWYDPDIPTRFTLTRSPGAAGIAGIAVLLACFLVFSGIFQVTRRQRKSA